MSTEVYDDPDKGLQYVEVGGVRRYLASIPSGGRMKAELPSYSGAGNPVFARSSWYDLSRRGAYGGFFDHVFDQARHSSCVGNGWAGGLQRARVLLGCAPVVLSPAFWYSLINGNQDAGANIASGIRAGMEVGTCLFSTVGQDPIYQSRMPAGARAEAQRFRLKAAYQCDTWDEVISALLTGRFIPVYGYQVGRNFGSFDGNGVAGHDRGRGNHCNCADGVKILPDGRAVLDNVNSWGRWGPWGNGRCYLDEQHLFGGGDEADVCVIQAAIEDAGETNEPPAYQP